MPPRKPAKPKEPTTIEEIQIALIKNLESEESALTNSRWDRGILYTKARKLFPDNKEFGAWCDKVPNVDHKVTISLMIQIVNTIVLNTYQELGYSRAAIFCSNNLSKYPEIRDKLIADAIAKNWTVKQCREEANKALVPDTKKDDAPPAEEANNTVQGLTATVKEQAEENAELRRKLESQTPEQESPFDVSDSADGQALALARKQLKRQKDKVKARNILLEKYVELVGFRLPEHDAMLALEAQPEAAQEAPEPQTSAEQQPEAPAPEQAQENAAQAA
ncbi:hypothetical protein [Enterobacter pseudoroggenkampii]|uniref:hypothetical protein n=1 Tax=Enterobacter pseudoroggenkampii TaxID=2996112 RepID=UPI002263D27B|nr:hypothetical protein [Enterobacter pseudoroggenkampii]MCX8289084.1 hypothetical protein [Enterobacter pseudoroggenkampii]